MSGDTHRRRRSLRSGWNPRTARLTLVPLLAALVVALAPDAARPQTATRNFLWKATARQGTVYLVGSIHLLTRDYYPLSPALDTAFAASDLLVEEVDLGEMLATESQLQIMMQGMLPSDETLDKVVSPETFAAVSRRVAALGMPLEPLRRFKPWALALMLLGIEWQNAGFDANLGLDKHFYDRARSEAKAVIGLETVAFQIARFDGLPMAQQDRLLAQTLKELDTQKAAVTTLANAWKAGDVGTIEQILLRDVKEEPQMYQRLIVERNRNWLPAIEALFDRRRPAFVVVGAAHLVGADGLLSMLRAKGYSLEQL
jgi:uncharacterized protein YbaP (TraB family)